MAQEIHRNEYEIFPPWGLLGAAGDSAKAAALKLLAAVLGAAVAAMIFLLLSILCIPLEILPERAKIEVRITNRDGQTISWYLSPYEEDRPDEKGPLLIVDLGEITEDITQLNLTDLDPDTWYELWFYPEGAEDLTDPVHRYPFRTGRLLPGDGPEDPGGPGAPGAPGGSGDSQEPGGASGGDPGEPPAETTTSTEETTEPAETTWETEGGEEGGKGGGSYTPPTQPPAPPAKNGPYYMGEPDIRIDGVGDRPPYTLLFLFRMNDATISRVDYSYTALIYGNGIVYEGGVPKYDVTMEYPVSLTGAAFTNAGGGEIEVAVPVGSTSFGIEDLRITLYYTFADGSTGTMTETYENLPGFLFSSPQNVRAVYNRATNRVDISMIVGRAPEGSMHFALSTDTVTCGGVIQTGAGMLEVDGKDLVYSFSVPYTGGTYLTLTDLKLKGDNMMSTSLGITSSMEVASKDVAIEGHP